jgi:hypothetical protein
MSSPDLEVDLRLNFWVGCEARAGDVGLMECVVSMVGG